MIVEKFSTLQKIPNMRDYENKVKTSIIST